jgi:hypothetical protein
VIRKGWLRVAVRGQREGDPAGDREEDVVTGVGAFQVAESLHLSGSFRESTRPSRLDGDQHGGLAHSALGRSAKSIGDITCRHVL